MNEVNDLKAVVNAQAAKLNSLDQTVQSLPKEKGMDEADSNYLSLC